MISGLDKASALRETQRELISKNKQGDKLPFPHDWGGSFIYIGEPVGKFV
jgi:CHAT domain-containing protein